MSGPGQQAVGEDARGRRDRACPPAQIVGTRQVHDQRVAGGPPLDLEDAGDGRRVLGVGPEPVHGLGRYRDDAAGPQPVDGRADIGGDELGSARPPTRRARAIRRGRRRGTRARRR